MKLRYEKIVSQEAKPHYKIKLSFEHGDADSTSYGAAILYTEDEVIQYIEYFKIVQDAIENRRSYGDHIDESTIQLGERLQALEYDVFAEGVSRYYAYPSIDSIEFTNGSDNFIVTY